MRSKRFHHCLAAAVLVASLSFAAGAAAATNTNIFFNASQTMTVVSSNLTGITINSSNYLFTYSQDGYFTGGVGLTNPVGRFFTVIWPNGVQAQAITVQPVPPVASGANITLKRADGKLFDLKSFTGKILLNTAGAGGAFEIMPQLNGNDAFADPLMYDCTGYGGQSFSHTPSLSGYDTYKIHMWGDFAITAITLMDTNPIPPPAPNYTIAASATPVGAGSAGGAGIYASNSPCTLSASANPGWGFKNWTENGVQASTSANYNFTVRSNRTLVANFVPAFSVTTASLPAHAGSTTGGGIFNSNATVTVTATPISGYRFVNWTDYGNPVSTLASYTFTATADRSLVANYELLTQAAIFDFDTGSPSLAAGNGMPGSQANRSVTAYFSTVSGSWSIQTRQTSIIGVNPVFSGNFLYPGTWGSAVQIQFSEPVTDISFDFTTGELNADWDIAGTMRVTAYTNSAATPAVGSGTSQGSWISGAYPEGHLSFHSDTPFTIVKIDESPVNTPSGLFFADNIVVQRVVATPTNVTVATSAFPLAGGTTAGGGTFTNGATVNVTAAANIGYGFVNWAENGAIVSTNASYTFAATNSRLLDANFIAGWSITASAATGGAATGGGFKADGATVTLTATANAGYFFTNWTEGGVQVSTAASYAFTATTNRALVANFVAGYTINASASPAAGGTVAGAGNYATGASATLTARANPGYVFTNWTRNGTQVSTSSNYTFTVSQNRTFVANFVMVTPSYTIVAVASPTNAATITGAGVFTNGANITVTATANSGFVFTDWSENGNIVSYTPDYSFTVSSNTTLVASFITNLPPVALGGTFYQLAGQPLTINIGDLMWNDHDPENDPFWFVSASATSSNSLALTVDTNTMQILIPANGVGDSFTYTITDSYDNLATGTGNIAITNSAAGMVLSLNAVTTPGIVTVNFSGVPWYYYEIERSTNADFSGPLQIWPVQAAADGSIQLTDDFLDLGGQPSRGFYRLKFLP